LGGAGGAELEGGVEKGGKEAGCLGDCACPKVGGGLILFYLARHILEPAEVPSTGVRVGECAGPGQGAQNLLTEVGVGGKRGPLLYM